jgi:hypothetical protein
MLTKILFGNNVSLYLIFSLWGQSDLPFLKKNKVAFENIEAL